MTYPDRELMRDRLARLGDLVDIQVAAWIRIYGGPVRASGEVGISRSAALAVHASPLFRSRIERPTDAIELRMMIDEWKSSEGKVTA